MQEDIPAMSEDVLRENLESQLSELEMLQSMFDNPGEVKIEDKKCLMEINDFVNKQSPVIPSYLDLTINLLVETLKFELCVNLSHEYPQIEPNLFVRNEKLNRLQHTKLNKDLTDYITTVKGDPCIYSAILWLQENAGTYIEQAEVAKIKEEKCDALVRLWIYSHHIYSKTKRREILHLAHTLKLTGFCMPGKPGVICVEGPSDDCNDWWQTIKAMNWKRIFCKVSEDCRNEETFLKFNTFEEVSFQSNGDRCNHMDIGELHKYLEERKCAYIFKELFGVEGK